MFNRAHNRELTSQTNERKRPKRLFMKEKREGTKKNKTIRVALLLVWTIYGLKSISHQKILVKCTKNRRSLLFKAQTSQTYIKNATHQQQQMEEIKPD